MRIGINARTFAVKEPDGAVQAARKLTESLCKKDDTEVILYGSEKLRPEFKDADRIYSPGFLSDSPFFGVVWERTILPTYINKTDIDVLLCPNGNAPATPVDCPVVTYLHDVNAQKGMSSGVHEMYRKVAIPIGVQNSEIVVTVSEFSKKEILTHLNISEDSVQVVYNGINEFYLNEGGEREAELPKRYLLYVGAMNPRKNVERLVRSYERICNEIPHKLVLIGPQNKSIYKNMDITLNTDKIITPGFVPEPELKYAYMNADGFIYPSLYEGFGLPPLEAMACGTSVVASNRTVFPELLNGYCQLVDPFSEEKIGSAMKEVATAETTSSQKKKLKQHARQFTWSKAANELLDVFREVIIDNR